VVRAYIEHKMYAAPVVKLFYSGPMFRYERPQKGRYRQFYQIGAEILGDLSPGADAEAIGMLMKYFASLGVEGTSLEINSLGCHGCRPGYKEKLRAFLEGRKGELCENCTRRIEQNPLRALDCKSHGCIEATKDAPSIMDALCTGCSAHFDEVKGRLAVLGIAFNLNSRMVRGLDYYTKTTFEITSGALGSQNAIAAGGRYDGLVEALGGPPTPCIGFAIGVERLSIILKERGFTEAPLVVFIALGAGAEAAAVKVVVGLREAGVRVFEDFSGGALKKRMKTADRLGARYTVILGEDELDEGCATLKDMGSATQLKVPIPELAGRLGVKAAP
jgi:histidyl-tRNA synthetase